MTAHSRRDDPRAQLDALLDHYESQEQAPAGRRIPVMLTAEKLGKVLGRAPRPGCAIEFNYRGYVIVAAQIDAERPRGNA